MHMLLIPGFILYYMVKYSFMKLCGILCLVNERIIWQSPLYEIMWYLCLVDDAVASKPFLTFFALPRGSMFVEVYTVGVHYILHFVIPTICFKI